MGYKIKDLAEPELEEYKGKIIAVLHSEQRDDHTTLVGVLGDTPIYFKVWYMTCLVKE